MFMTSPTVAGCMPLYWVALCWCPVPPRNRGTYATAPPHGPIMGLMPSAPRTPPSWGEPFSGAGMTVTLVTTSLNLGAISIEVSL